MKSSLRRPAALAVGFVATLFFGFAALAQTPSAGAVKPNGLFPPISAELARSVFLPRPRGCFCDEDCYAEMLVKEKAWKKSQPIFKWDLSLPKFRVQLPKSENEIRAIDLEGLKKVLQRDPNDKRPLLVNFWATWCDPCREEFPDLVKLDADYKGKGLNFIAISVDDISDIKSEVPKFLNQMKATMPVVLLNMSDPEPAIKFVDPTWGGDMPATFLYDKDGRVVFKHFGKIKPDELRAAIDKELKK
jgi:thiol-disulfide isomerase/thioredoxin